MKEVLEKLKVDFEYLTGGQYTGLIKAIGAGFASRIYEFYSKLKFIEKQAFIETADKDYLYLHTGNLLPPKGSETATGYVVFFGEEGAKVPLGTEIKDDNGSFITKVEGTVRKSEFTGIAKVEDGVVTIENETRVPSCSCIANNTAVEATASYSKFSFKANNIKDGDQVTIKVYKTDKIEVDSNEIGYAGNRDFGDKLKTKVTINGINKEAGVIILTGGRDAESVEEYRKRVKFFISNPQAPFNQNNIKAVLLENIRTLKYAWIKGGEDKSGEVKEGGVKVYLLNESYGLEDEEKKMAIGLVKGLRPVQMNPENIEVVKADIKYINVVIRNLEPSNKKIKKEVKKNIEYLFDDDLFERTMQKNQIESVVYRTESGLEKVTKFEIPNYNCEIKPGEFLKLGKVSFE